MGRASDRHRGEPWTLGDRVSHLRAADALTLVVGPVSCTGALEPPWPRSPGAAGTRPLPGRDHHLRHGRMPRGRGQGPLSPPHPRSSEFGLWSVDWTSDTCVLSSRGRLTPPTPRRSGEGGLWFKPDAQGGVRPRELAQREHGAERCGEGRSAGEGLQQGSKLDGEGRHRGGSEDRHTAGTDLVPRQTRHCVSKTETSTNSPAVVRVRGGVAPGTHLAHA